MTCADDPRDDALFEEAAAWLARLREPGASAAERDAFARWRDADPNHAAAFAEAQALWDDLAAPVAAALARCPETHPTEPLSPLGRGKSRKAQGEGAGSFANPNIRHVLPLTQPSPRGGEGFAPSRWPAIAASITMLIAATVWVAGGGLENLQADYVTAAGESRTVTLADGSRATLNTDTALAVTFSDGERRLTLLRGEAFFDVAPDPARPFAVTAPGGQARALGTRFNLRLDGSGVVAAVEEGVVAATPAASPGAALTLTAGQTARIEPASARRLDGVEAADETAWRRGQLVFFRAPLGEVAAALNRYHRGYIVILNDDLRAKPVTGVFDAARPVAAVDLIEAALGARSYRLGDRLIMLR